MCFVRLCVRVFKTASLGVQVRMNVSICIQHVCRKNPHGSKME